MKKDYLNENLYFCFDLCLASVLSLTFPVEKTHKTSTGKIFFCFNDDTNLEKLIDDYWADKLTVEPKQFFQNIKILKSRIYQGRNYDE